MLRGCLVCVICNSSSFHSFIFKLCIMIVHTLNMYTLYLCTFDNIFLSVKLRNCYITYCRLHCVIWVYSDFIPVYLTLHIDCSHIDDLHWRRRSRAEFGLVYLSLHLLPFFVYTSSKGCVETVNWFMLVGAFAAGLCDIKYMY